MIDEQTNAHRAKVQVDGNNSADTDSTVGLTEEGEMLRIATSVGGLALAAVCAVGLATPAGADDTGYLARLDRSHVSYITHNDALHWGGSVCDSLRNGTPVPEVVTTLKNGGGFTTRDAGAVIGAATSELCPDQYQTAMDWAYGQVGG